MADPQPDTGISSFEPRTGRVVLVGAGPGDPKLITVRGLECLQQADVILYDYLVNPALASWARPTAERICLGKHGKSRIWSQEEIHAAFLHHARAGKYVVRLKGGDPAIFARGAEEAEFLARHGIPFEIVPGITAALAAGSHAGIPLTHRACASAVAFVTGHEQDARDESQVDFAALARFPGTLVVYMGVTTAGQWVRKLIDNGMAPSTPVALVRRCSLHDQQTVHCFLHEVPDHLTPYRKFPPPVIAILGPVAATERVSSWFTSLPLHGHGVLIPRAADQACEAQRELMGLGAGVWHQPAIEIHPPPSLDALDEAIRNAARYRWIVFSSAKGVDSFCRRLSELGLDARTLGACRLAAIGPATAAALGRYHLSCDLQPEEFCAEALAVRLLAEKPLGPFVLVRGRRGRPTLEERLNAAGALVTPVVAYESLDVTVPQEETVAALRDGHIHWTLITSSAVAKSLHRMLGDDLSRANLVSISPRTSETLRELGLPVVAEAREYTLAGMLQALLAKCHSLRK